MKKFLAFGLCIALLFALAIPAAAHAQVRLPEAPKADIVIDGVRDEGYGEPHTIDKIRDGNTGATGTLWTAWNDTGVFYYVEVKDTTPNHEHSNSYERDCIEFFIDWNSANPIDLSNSGDPAWQVRIASAPDSSDQQMTCGQIGDETLISGTHYVVKPLVGNDLNGGYIMEVWLPIALADDAKPLKEGGSVIVDFQIADNQEDAGRSSQAFLDPDDDLVDNQWQNTEAFTGTLPLGAAKAAPVVVEEEPAEVMGTGGGDPAELPAVISAPAAVAPRTADPIAIFAIGSIISAAGVVIVRRKK